MHNVVDARCRNLIHFLLQSQYQIFLFLICTLFKKKVSLNYVDVWLVLVVHEIKSYILLYALHVSLQISPADGRAGVR